MTARWASRRTSRRVGIGLLAALLSPLIAAALSIMPGFPGAQVDAAPLPFVSLVGVPTAPLIGQDVSFDISFQNTSPTDAGYGPYIDLNLPVGADLNDGLTINPSGAVTYLGSPVTYTVLTAAGGCITHPYAVQSSGLPVQMCGLVDGSAYVVIRLPFGSFTPGQPDAVVHVTTHLSSFADAGTPETITARGGYQFGATPVDDHATDPSIIGATPATTDISPTVIEVKKTCDAPESETATGPNFPHTYTITVTVAPGQTVTDLTITDALPDNIQYLFTDTPSVAFRSITEPTGGPGGSLTINFGDVMGTGGEDATATFHFYVPRVDAEAAAVLDPSTGAFSSSTDTVNATGSWQPSDVRDPLTVVNAAPASHTLADKSIAVQKTVAISNDQGPAGANPGDTLEWTINIQVSDYFALDTVVVDDLLGDGTHFDDKFRPTLSVNGNGITSAGDFSTDNFTADPVDHASGTTSISFRLSDELVTRNFDGKLLGGCVDPAGIALPSCAEHNTGGTTAQIVFRSVVQQTYDKTGLEVVEGDTLHNDAAATGIVLNTLDLTETGNHIGDGGSGATPAGTSADITIQRGVFQKSIYAINGVIRNPLDTTPVHVSPGNTVTYRLQQGFPTSRTDDFRITDYLPLPIFDASALTFNPVMDDTAPATGHAKYGPSDTFHRNCNDNPPGTCPDHPDAPPPAVTFDTTANSVTFTYGDYALYYPAYSQADILFTVTVSTSPFADGLLLTNQAQSQTKNAAGVPENADAIVQITLDQPVLGITKGVVGTDNVAGVFAPVTKGPVPFATIGAPPSVTCPGFTGSVTSTGLGTSPVDSNLTGVDAGDYVRFAIVIQNTGHAAAYQIRIKDTQPNGFSVPGSGLQMCVSSGVGGVGSDIGYTNYLGGTGLFDKGIELNDGANGALAEGVDADGVANPTGSNIVVITYTLQLDTAVVPSSTITNTASLINYANDPTAADHLPTSSPLTDDATVTMAAPVAAKAMTGTNQTITSGSNVAIGEIATYQITLTVPEGTLPGAKVVDTLPAGLVPMTTGCSTLASDGVTSTTVTFGSSCVMGTNPTVVGQLVTFDLGTVTNSNSSNGTAETITLTYNVVVTNVASNKYNPTTTLQNGAALTWTGGSLPAVHAGNLTVVEPGITTTKTSDKTTGDAGDTIKYTVSIVVASGTNREDAADVDIKDQIPANMTYVPSSLTQTAGTAPTSATVVSGLITIDWSGAGNILAQGATETFTFQATIDTAAVPGRTFINTATTTWSSLPGSWTTAQSTYSAVSTERTGLSTDPGLSLNSYNSSSTQNVTMPKATVAKSITATSQSTTSLYNVAIGEIVTYQLVLTIPEGTMPAAQLVDTLPAGLAFVRCDSIAGSSADVQGTYTNACNAPTNPTVGSGGQVVTFSLGTITNVNTDNGTAETITLSYDAVVLNIATNKWDSGQTLQNSAALTWPGCAATCTATAQAPKLTVVEPIMTIAKSPSPSTGDAGDVITFTINIANPAGTNRTDAFDVVWTDSIPAGLTYFPHSLTCIGDCPLPANLDDSHAPALSGTWAHYVLGHTTTITYQATLNANVPSGARYTNTADLTWTSLPGTTPTDLSTYNTNSRERTGTLTDPGGAANTYDKKDHATVTVPQPSPVKTLVCTSEAGTGTTHVAVGEIARYRVATIIPEGVTPSLNLKDVLPAGLSYFKDGTATVAFVANQGGIASTAFSGAGLQVSGNSTWTGDPTFPMPLAQISGAPLTDGVGPTFDFGTVTNSDSDDDAEMIVVEFNVLVDNVSGNKAGVPLTDQATIYSDSTALADAGSATLTVAEPSITFTKTVTTTPHDGGDTVVYHIAITNGSGGDVSPADDVQFVDSLDATLTLGGVSVSNLTGVTNTTNYTTGVVTLNFLVLAPGETRTIDITATVANNVVAGTTIPNTANATWTSLPGTGGTTPNDTGSTTPTGSGTATGERDGGGGINNYSASAGAPVTLDKPSISKLAPPDPSLPVGGTTTFDLVVTLPEGTTKSLIVTDTLPAGLTPMGASTIITTASGSSGLTADYSGTTPSCTESAPGDDNGGAWTFTCGDIYLPPDGNSTNNSFVIRIHVRVANVAANISGKQLINSAGLTYTDPASGTTPVAAPLTRTITVLEPKLTVTKSVLSATPHYGDTVTYTLTISHTGASNSTAYNVVVTDTLPSGMTLQTGTLTHTGGLVADSKTAVGGTITLTFNSIDKLSTSTYTYQAVILGAGTVGLNIGSTLTNNAVATWTSMPGAVYKRTGNPSDPGLGLNNYTKTGTAPLTIGGADMRLAKTHAGTGTAASTITWTLTYYNEGNQNATGVTLAETVPVGTTYTGSGWTCASGTGAGSPCTRNIGTVNAGTHSSVTFVVTVVDPIPTTLTTISNTAVVADDGNHGADPTPLNNTASDSVTPPTVNLSLTKTVDDDTPDANQLITFTIKVSNAGPSAATNVKVTDILPAGLTYSALTSFTGGGSYDPGTGLWLVGTVASGGSQTLTLKATVTASGPVTNYAEVSDCSQRDTNSTPGNRTTVHEDDDASASVTPNIADLGVTKSASPQYPDVGSLVTYKIVATNHGYSAVPGTHDATGVVVTDALPAGLTYSATTSATKGTYDSGTHKWNIGTLADGESATLTLVATVDSLGTIQNTATIAGAPFDPDLTNNTASASTSQLVDLAVTKAVDNATPNVGDSVIFTVVVTDLGPGTATNVVILDKLPAGLTYDGSGSSASQGTYDAVSGHWNVGTIPVDGHATLTIKATVTGSDAMTNTASVFSVDEPEGPTTNNSDSKTVTPPHADMQLTKTVLHQNPNPVDRDTFTITITNAGPDQATNVVVTDVLPGGLDYDSPTAWSATEGTFDPATGKWTVGTMDLHGTATLTLYIVVTTAGDYTNTATVTEDQFDPTPGNNTDSASISTGTADIKVVKTADNDAPTVDTTVTYTVNVSNIGHDNATQLVIHDLLPAGLAYISSTASTGTYDPNTGDWTIGDLDNQGTVDTLTITAQVAGSGTIDNTAAVKHLLQRDSDPSNDHSTAEIKVPPAADLSLTKTVDNAMPDKGTDITFTVTVINHGPNGTSGVHVGDPLPAGTTWLSDVPSVGTYDHTTGDWNIGDMANGDTVTLTITVSVDVEGPMTNTAQVTASDLPDPDSTPNNDNPGEDDQSSVQINSRGVVDLAVTKAVTPTSLRKGQQATYTITVKDNGPDGSTGVIVRDTLPAGVTYVSSSGGTYDKTTGAWTVGSLASGSTATLTITVSIVQTGSITNVVEVAACDQHDTNPDNDSASAVLSAAGATAPPTATGSPIAPLGDPGSLLPWLLGLTAASMLLMASAAMTARSRRVRAYFQSVPQDLPPNGRSGGPHPPGS